MISLHLTIIIVFGPYPLHPWDIRRIQKTFRFWQDFVAKIKKKFPSTPYGQFSDNLIKSPTTILDPGLSIVDFTFRP